jgi:hypothetical protein
MESGGVIPILGGSDRKKPLHPQVSIEALVHGIEDVK